MIDAELRKLDVKFHVETERGYLKTFLPDSFTKSGGNFQFMLFCEFCPWAKPTIVLP